MSNGKGTALVIISLIIGASGLGVGVFSVIRFQVIEGPQGEPGVDGVNGINGTLNNVVGLWESLSGGPAYMYKLILGDNQINESEFYSLTNGNTTITLTQPGWYRLNFRFAWLSLSSLYTYWFYIEKNTVIEHELVWVYNLATTDYLVSNFAYVYSDGNDVFDFYCVEPSATDFFSITSNHEYNQFVLEYVKEP